MNGELIMLYIIFTIDAIVSIWFGYRIGKQKAEANAVEDNIEEIKEKAFAEAKKEYLKHFHAKYDPAAESAVTAYDTSLRKENEELREQNQLLKDELKKERKKK